MINASFSSMLCCEMVSNLEPNQVILEEKKLLHFIRMKIKWISIRMKLLSSTSCLTVMNTWDIFRKMTLLFGKISIFDGRQKIQPTEKCQCRTRKYIYRRRS
jgi:hypothetical protein